MLTVKESTFPKLCAQASQVSQKWQTLFLALFAANIVLMGAPAAIDMMLISAEHSDHAKQSTHEENEISKHDQTNKNSNADFLLAIDKIFVVLAGTTTLCVLFLPFRNDWLEARRLAESLKTQCWKFMAKAQPYSTADDDAQELLLSTFSELAAGHKGIAGSVTAEKVDNKDLGDLQTVRDCALKERINLYREFRVKDQLDYYSSKAANFHSKHVFFSAMIIVLQITTFLCLTFGTTIEEITKSVALCIAASIGLLGWRDFRKYDEQSTSFGAAAQQLSLLQTKADKISTESEWNAFVNSVESVLAKEQKLWLLKIGDEYSGDDEISGHSKTIGCFRQRPLEVTAVRVHAKTKVQTLEGEEEANSGDWIITGSRGEQWPVGSATFAKKYKAVPNTNDRFRKLPVEVEAVQMNNSFTIETKWGKQSGVPGDWIVFTDSHDSYICKNDIFFDSYESVRI